ncbi:MAG: hypothetical protein H6626_04595 [Pseudobdellovibrionaceae bacterium]|nr:hypothetical protein [Bdellovibrionales bacterium]USN48373.1 MAG: hypothetical protein H6626_04595 [Pseudobdellovibrionaceae bacterium]
MANIIKCFNCGAEISVDGVVGRREECASCGADVHVCKNCRFYDTGSYNECKEPSADVVREKERANFCDYFEPGGHQQGKNKQDELKAAAEALFKKNN